MVTRKVWKKTAKGEEEIRSRTNGLALNLRQVLILIDGVSDEAKILQKGLSLPTDIRLCLQKLDQQEYIQVESVLTIADVKNELIRIAEELLGADAEKVIDKIKDAPDDKEGLVSALSRCKKIVKMTINEEKADALIRKCAAVLDEIPAK